MASSALATAFVNIVPGTQQLEGYLKTGISGPAGAGGMSAGKSMGSGMVSSLKKFAGPLAAAVSITSVVQWASKTITSLGRIEKISAQTGSALKATGAGAWTSVKAVEDLASSLENLTGTEAESIQEGANLLLTFKNVKNEAGAGNDIFNQAVTAMTDMARAMGTDASSGAIQLGKALNDPTKGITALTRVGVTFSDEQKNMIKNLQATGDMAGAQKIILQELNSEFGGSGAAYAATYAGKVDLLKHAFGTLSEGMLGGIMPVLTQLVTAMTVGINKVIDFGKKIGEVFKNAGGGGAGFSASIQSIFTNITNFISGGGLTSMFQSLSAARSGFIQAILDALPGLIDALVIFIPQFLTFIVGTFIPQIIGSFSSMVTQITDLLVTAIPQIVQMLVEGIPALAKALIGALPGIIQAAITLFNGIIDGLITVLPMLIMAWLDYFPVLIETLLGMLPAIVDGALALFLGLVDGLVVALPILLDTLVNKVIPKAIDAIVTMLPKLIDGAVKLFVGIITGLMKAQGKIIAAVVKLIPVLIKTIIGLIPQIISAGIQITIGLAKGIIQNAPMIIGEVVKGLADLVVGGFKALLGIKSPSRVFHGFGINITEGLVNGLSAGSSELEATMTKMKDWITKNFESGKITKAAKNAALKLVDTYTKALAPLAAKHEEILKQIDDAQKALADKVKERADFIASTAARFGSGLNITDTSTAADAIAQLTEQIAKNKELKAVLEDLNKLGLSNNLYDQILKSGNVDFAKSIRDGGASTIDQLNSLAAEADATASSLAEKAGSLLFDQGVSVAQGILDGLTKQEAALNAKMEALADTFLAKITSTMAGGQTKEGKKSGITAFASGGFVTGPTRALIGEAGPEVVTPLKDFERMIGLNGSGAGAKTVNYFAAPNNSLDSEEQLFEAIKRAKVVANW